MHFTQSSPFDCSHSLSDSQKWDPDVVLGDIDGGSCIGLAKTRGRRCGRWIAQHKTTYGRGMLSRLACDSPSKAAESPILEDAADILLCWQHTNQLSEIIRRWKRKLETCADEIEAKDKSYIKDDITRKQKDTRQRSSNYAVGESMLPRNIKREEDELAQRKRQDQENQRLKEENKRLEEERKRLEEEKKRLEEEKRRLEEEKRKLEEEERKRKEEESKREQKAREEAFRERVRLAKAKREREARERAEKEAASWRTAWERYSSAWSRPADVSATNIPWPVKSGLQSDVDEANVRLFFAKAPPADSVDPGDKRFKLISEENRRWHTDKMMQRFGSDVVNGAAKGPLSIVAKVMIELRQEARNER
ncbi:hypothetical protein F4805DRAFT_427682 [Annulohypoxylon moriforme]|nr:hypothetical protein F4805DRAFT_427682 [Annulohypoxylon moriforme]